MSDEVEQATGLHSTGVRDRIEGFVEFFEPFVARPPPDPSTWVQKRGTGYPG